MIKFLRYISLSGVAVLFFTSVCGCRFPSSLVESSPSPTGPANGTISPADGTFNPANATLPSDGAAVDPWGAQPSPSPAPDAAAVTPLPQNEQTVSATLYYVTDEGYLLPVSERLPMEPGIARACLERMTEGGGNTADLLRRGLNAPIPAGTELSLAILNGEARLDLRNLPSLADSRAEQNLFAAIVNTLANFSSVESVTIFINGSSAPTANGVTPPTRSGRMPLNAETTEVPTSGNAAPLTLYFPNQSGSLFVPVTRYVQGGIGLGAAIAALADGTPLPGLRACFPENTLVLGAGIENGLLTVNLSDDFLRISETPGLYSLAMQSVLLTAMQYGSVDEVVFTVNGLPFELSY